MSRRGSFVTPLAAPDHEPDLSPELKAAVVAALREAWGDLRETQLGLLRAGEEEAITHALERVLNQQEPATGRRKIRRLDLFETVSREASVSSVGGGYKRAPDLVFRPSASVVGVRCRSDWGYWVEAKILDASHPLHLYFSQGIDRFVSGQYAARMPSGGMAAYVRDRTRPAAAFDGHESIVFIEGVASDSGTSTHERAAMVAIVLTHLWLDAA